MTVDRPARHDHRPQRRRAGRVGGCTRPFFATPFLIKDPVGTARRVRTPIGRAGIRGDKVLADRQNGFAYLARKVKASQAARKVERLKIEGIGVLDDSCRDYPEGERRRRSSAPWGSTTSGLSGVEQQLDEELRGADGEQRIVKGRPR